MLEKGKKRTRERTKSNQHFRYGGLKTKRTSEAQIRLKRNDTGDVHARRFSKQRGNSRKNASRSRGKNPVKSRKGSVGSTASSNFGNLKKKFNLRKSRTTQISSNSLFCNTYVSKEKKNNFKTPYGQNIFPKKSL